MSLLCHRLLFAIKPGDQILPAIAEHRRAQPLDRAVHDRHAHITMGIFDDIAGQPSGLIERLHAVGDATEASSFSLLLGRLVGTTRSVALRPGTRSTGLMRLHAAIDEGVRRAGLAVRRGWSFNPHLTLGYRDGAAFARAVEPIPWAVDELVLVHSFVGEQRHETVGRWTLGADPQLSLF